MLPMLVLILTNIFQVGPSMAGKSYNLLQILKFHKQLFTTEFTKILYCMPEKHLSTQKDFLDALRRACPQIELRGSQPTFADFRSTTLPKLIILDDMILSLDPAILEELFTQDSHHFR